MSEWRLRAVTATRSPVRNERAINNEYVLQRFNQVTEKRSEFILIWDTKFKESGLLYVRESLFVSIGRDITHN